MTGTFKNVDQNSKMFLKFALIIMGDNKNLTNQDLRMYINIEGKICFLNIFFNKSSQQCLSFFSRVADEICRLSASIETAGYHIKSCHSFPMWVWQYLGALVAKQNFFCPYHQLNCFYPRF